MSDLGERALITGVANRNFAGRLWRKWRRTRLTPTPGENPTVSGAAQAGPLRSKEFSRRYNVTDHRASEMGGPP